jgi:hypothetical protein
LANAAVMVRALWTGGGLALLTLFGLGAAALVGRRVWARCAGRPVPAVRLMAPARWTALTAAAGLAANLAANLISGNPDRNYMMTFVPLAAWPVGWLMAKAVQGLRAGFAIWVETEHSRIF